jgi:K+-sensing histidine kinase KdpD
MVGRRRGFHLCLAHVFPTLPPELLEFGGAEEPQEEESRHARHKADLERWIAAAKEAGARALEGARRILRKAGVAAAAIRTEFFDPVEGRDVAEEILNLARVRRCHTIVIGRESHSWFTTLIRGDLVGELVRRGKGVTIWVVE